MTRRIIHLDLDAFFCSVEEQNNPDLIGKPFAVGGRPEERGVVASCSYPARKFGVRSAMPMGKALRLCPGLLIVSSSYKNYSAVSKQVMERLYALTPEVEQVSIDEAFLEVTDRPEPIEEICASLQAKIQQELGLPCSLGAASNKLVAKIATDYAKASRPKDRPPNAIHIVPAGKEMDFLGSLPVDALWGVGPKTAARLAELGIYTIETLREWSELDLLRRFGKNGADLARRARGIDESPIVTWHETKSISQETTFVRDVSDRNTLLATILDQTRQVAQRLKKKSLVGQTVKIKLRWSDFTTITRQTSLEQPTADEKEILQAAEKLFSLAWVEGQPVRLLGMGVAGLGPPIIQLNLWESASYQKKAEKELRLTKVVQEIQQKFGSQLIHWGATQGGSEEQPE